MPPQPKARPATGPTNPKPSTSILQSISDQHRLSEQPEDLQSIHTPDDDLEPIDKGKGWEDPPPGNNELDDDPDDDPQDDDEEDGKKFFKKLLLTLDKPMSEPPQAKICNPKVYDGNNQGKLRTFFLQCMLNFQDHPKAFATGAAKIQYASLTSLVLRSNTLNQQSSAKLLPSLYGLQIGTASMTNLKQTSALSTMLPKPRLNWKKLL